MLPFQALVDRENDRGNSGFNSQQQLSGKTGTTNAHDISNYYIIVYSNGINIQVSCQMP
jgi:hypothetical protein